MMMVRWFQPAFNFSKPMKTTSFSLASRWMYKQEVTPLKESQMKLHYLHLKKMMQRPPKRDSTSDRSFQVMNWAKTKLRVSRMNMGIYWKKVIPCPSVHIIKLGFWHLPSPRAGFRFLILYLLLPIGYEEGMFLLSADAYSPLKAGVQTSRQERRERRFKEAGRGWDCLKAHRFA